ncbi:MAG: STAS domain-containing protein [Geitlerinemataceae cyanobacterium]
MAVVLQLKGRLDLVGAAKLRQYVERYLLAKHPKSDTWVLDLSSIEFVGHSGIRLLVALRRLAQQRGNRLVLRHPTAAVRSVLEVALLGDEFELWLDREDTGEEDIVIVLDTKGESEEKEKSNSLASSVVASLRSKLSQAPRP